MTPPLSLPASDPLPVLLERSPHLWRGRELARIEARATQYPGLDARLPGGGWPIGALIEIAPRCHGLGELRLVLPALKSWCDAGRTIALVQPPHIPYAPALVRFGLSLSSLLWIATSTDEDAHWAAEQLLREGAAAVLLWSSVQADRALRRLQLAAEAGKACAFLYRPPAMQAPASPAALRLTLSASPDGLRVEIVKVRGGNPTIVTLSLTSPPT